MNIFLIHTSSSMWSFIQPSSSCESNLTPCDHSFDQILCIWLLFFFFFLSFVQFLHNCCSTSSSYPPSFMHNYCSSFIFFIAFVVVCIFVAVFCFSFSSNQHASTFSTKPSTWSWFNILYSSKWMSLFC